MTRQRSRRTKMVAAAVGILITLLPLFPQMASAVPSVKLSITTGHVLNNETVTGTGFAANSAITIKFDGVAMVTNHASVISSSSGGFKATFVIPQAVAGSHTITVSDAALNTVTRTFTVTSFASVIAIAGHVGITETVTGTGFAANSAITIKFDGVAMVTNPASVTSNSTGGFKAAFVIPQAVAGSHTITVSDASGNTLTMTFTVKPAILLSQTTGPVGTTLKVTGTGFAGSSVTTVTFAGASQGTVTTNSTGSFTKTFAIPTSTFGAKTVTATESASHKASATFTVTASISLSTTSGPVGATVTVTGAGFAARSLTTVRFNSAAQNPAVTTDVNGGFTKTFTIPTSTLGAKTVTATDSASHTASATFNVTSGTSLSLSPNSGAAGSSLTVNGTGFAPSSSTTIKYDTVIQATVTTTSGGAIPTGTTFTVPASTTGPHTVTATDSSANTASATFTVIAPTLSVSPASGPVGTVVTVNGTGFAGSSVTTVTFAGASQGTVTTNSTGSFTKTFNVPAATAGANTVQATDAFSNTASATFVVTPAITVTPTSGPAGTSVGVTGTGFAGTSTITIKYDGTAQTTNPATVMSDSTGSFSATFTVPASATGANTVSATDPSANSASAQFNVAAPQASYLLTVTTRDSNGTSIPGMWTVLTQNNAIIATGFSPINFTLNTGAQYDIAVSNFGIYQFAYWLDSGSPIEPRPISISSDTQLTAIYRNTELVLTPGLGPAGTTVIVNGQDFASNSHIALTFKGLAIATNPSNITSNSTGFFKANFSAPSISDGTYPVQATDSNNHTSVQPFTVGPLSSISLYPSQGHPGDNIRVTGTNFSPNSLINIDFDGSRQNNSGWVDQGSTPFFISTDSSGVFVAIITTPDTANGTHSVTASDSANDNAAATYGVSPSAFIFPSSGHAGSAVKIASNQGSGFAAGSTIAISFDGSPLATTPAGITTGTAGNFGPANFTVPTNATTGQHQILISDSQGNSYSTSFNLTSTNTPTFSVHTLVKGFKQPDRLVFIPDNGPGVDGSGSFMVTQKNGTVLVVKNLNGSLAVQSVPFVSIPVQVHPEDAGLLGIAINPNWVSSKLVYFYITVNTTGTAYNEVVRYNATTDSSGNIVADQNVGQELILGNIPAAVNHNGGDLKFDSQGNLYISTGDNFLYTPGQDITTLGAKILRIFPLASPVNGLLYSIPSSNPFALSASQFVKKEIWGSGVRNPYTFDIDSQTGKVYVSDVGFNTWERIRNFTAPGSNGGWGWPYGYEGPMYGNPQNLRNFTEPLYWYPHTGVEPNSGPANGLEAITGGVFYHCTASATVACYPSQLQGAYFFGDYAVGFISAMLPSSTSTPQIDPATGVPRGQVQPLMYGLVFAPLDLEVWHGKVYYVSFTGSIGVLNYG